LGEKGIVCRDLLGKLERKKKLGWPRLDGRVM
jgi:hypothetical protein